MSQPSVSITPAEIAYGFRRTIPTSYAQAVARARAALQKEGFGVLFEIDMKEKLKEKLNVDFQPYVILGACHPSTAYQVLQEEIDLGLLLPCNVIVYEQGGQSVVAAIDAAKMMTVVGNPKLETQAALINEKLQRVIENL